MKLNIAICDDDKAIINRLTKLLSSFQIEQDIDLYIETFQNGQALIERYRNPNVKRRFFFTADDSSALFSFS